MKLKNHVLVIFMACLLLSSCAAPVPGSAPAAGMPEQRQGVVLPEKENAEEPQVEPKQPPAEEAPATTVSPAASNPDVLSSATQEEEASPAPVEPEDVPIIQTVNTCMLSINCATVLDNLDALTQGKEELVPADGWLLNPVEVTFHEGENVFQVLSRVCKQEKLHMEFADTPGYDSAYIEGIGNLYEFDCGPLSGWKYRVNGWFPNYGCSRYQVQSGDVIEWLYTCDLGGDIGGGEGQ